MDNWLIRDTVDLAQPQAAARDDIWAALGDRGAHTWELTVIMGGAPADLTGAAVMGMILRADGATVPIDGTITGNVASVTFPQEAYAVEGKARCVIKLEDAAGLLTAVRRVMHVERESSDVVVVLGETIPSLLQAISDAQDATDSATTAAAAANAAALTAGVSIKGKYMTLGALQTAHPTGAPGDAYLVGLTQSTVLYIWDTVINNWTNAGPLGKYIRTNQSTAQQTGFSGDTYLDGSFITCPDSPAVGSAYRLTFDVTKTAAGIAAPVISIRLGANAAVTDPALLTFTFGAGTAAIDTGVFVVDVVFRTVGSGTAAVIQGVARLTSNLTTTGISNAVKAKVATSAGFDSTTNGIGIGASYNGGASAAHTVQLVRAELLL